MELEKALSIIEKFESHLSQTYEILKSRFADDSEASGLFYRLSINEQSHCDTVRYQQRVARNSDLLQAPVQMDMDAINQAMDTVQYLTTASLPLDETLKHCLSIENNPSATYFLSIMEQVSQEIAPLLKNMINLYREHYADLLGFMKERRIDTEGAETAAALEVLGLHEDEIMSTYQENSPIVDYSHSEAEQKSGKILVVEDNMLTRNVLISVLKTAGHEVHPASDGLEGFKKLTKEPFDLVISDIQMPNMDGYKLLEFMNANNIKTPLMFLTSLDKPVDREKAKKLGAVEFLSKPVKKEVLLFSVEVLLM